MMTVKWAVNKVERSKFACFNFERNGKIMTCSYTQRLTWNEPIKLVCNIEIHVFERICVDNSWRTRNRVKIKHDSLSWYFLHISCLYSSNFFTLIRVISLWLLIFFLSVSMSDNSTLIDKLTDSSTILFFDHLTLNLKNQCSSKLCFILVFYN